MIRVPIVMCYSNLRSPIGPRPRKIPSKKNPHHSYRQLHVYILLLGFAQSSRRPPCLGGEEEYKSLTLISADTIHGTFLESSGSAGHWLRLLVEYGKRQVRSRYEVMARPNPRFHVFAGRLKLACSKPPMHCMGIALIVRNSKLVRQGLELHISSRDTGHSFSRRGQQALLHKRDSEKDVGTVRTCRLFSPGDDEASRGKAR